MQTQSKIFLHFRALIIVPLVWNFYIYSTWVFPLSVRSIMLTFIHCSLNTRWVERPSEYWMCIDGDEVTSSAIFRIEQIKRKEKEKFNIWFPSSISNPSVSRDEEQIFHKRCYVLTKKAPDKRNNSWKFRIKSSWKHRKTQLILERNWNWRLKMKDEEVERKLKDKLILWMLNVVVLFCCYKL